MDEVMSPDAEGAYTARAVRCHACAAKAAAVDNHEGNAGGLYWTVEHSG